MALREHTQSIDHVNGGVKVNDLPEQASVVVNRHIRTESFVAAKSTRKRVVKTSRKRHVSYVAFGICISNPDVHQYGILTPSDRFIGGLESAQVTI
ncbi:uncharacterized protein BJ212DRAFT_510808 [Suillus subaureus]|uniref:Uncharacterized protein n=1 Tax=Suillus subaureus TaxID=48587 RepID=A0A9P7E5M5_9AGAM|nr:uncharacterized protein BJ212DRAFT_510808 [Suillus subaureus]KAG1811434.1 hypothetical protein BJ212DRAFT_510808 [Suillus subaureus]